MQDPPAPPADRRRPAILVSAPASNLLTTAVLALGEHAKGLAYAWGRLGHTAGQSNWQTRAYPPGRLPGMATGPLGDVVVHTLTTDNAALAQTHWHSAQRLAATDEGEVLSFWN